MLVGREKEIKELNELYYSKKSELVVVYGRRRVGKTTLVDEMFKDLYAFKYTGKSKADLEKENSGKRKLNAQLSTFYLSLKLFGLQEKEKPNSWDDAFYLLIKLLESKPKNQKQVVFIDEVPWLDTPKSHFVESLEWFWNFYGSSCSNLLLILSGSSTSWIMNEIINNHGGLFNRVTAKIRLKPMTLNETEKLLLAHGINYSRYDVVTAHMILGGIPYYLDFLKRGESLSSGINRIFFGDSSELEDEFNSLFASSFTSYELCKKIVRFLNTKSSGYTSNEILKGISLSDSKTFRDSLRALEKGDFIVKYVPFKSDGREKIYKLVDPFCLFYLRFIEGRKSLDKNIWIDNSDSKAITTWRGLAFENTCFNHIEEIKKALGYFKVESMQFSFKGKDEKGNGTQIDLLIERSDHIISLCEMKFLSDNFTVDKNYYEKLKARKSLVQSLAHKKSIVQHVLITTFGLTNNNYSSAFDSVITLDDLFQ